MAGDTLSNKCDYLLESEIRNQHIKRYTSITTLSSPLLSASDTEHRHGDWMVGCASFDFVSLKSILQ